MILSVLTSYEEGKFRISETKVLRTYTWGHTRRSGDKDKLNVLVQNSNLRPAGHFENPFRGLYGTKILSRSVPNQLREGNIGRLNLMFEGTGTKWATYRRG